MPLYTYVATTVAGQHVKGRVEAKSKDLALNVLKEKGLYVISIKEKPATFLDDVLKFRRISSSQLVAFTRQLSAMISAGLPLPRALDILGEQASSAKMRTIVNEILHEVEAGAPLSAAMGRYPDAFSPTYQSLIKAGESSGKLDSILERLAETLEAQRELASKFKSAMIYPTVVFIAMIGVFILMMVMVVPKLADLYKNLNVDLPASTDLMIAVSDFMVGHMFLVFGGGALVVVLLRIFLQTQQGKDLVTTIAFWLPIFGKINYTKELADFTRTLGLLIGAGMPIVEALTIVSNVVSNFNLRRLARDGASRVEKGVSFASFLKQDNTAPALLTQMTAVGEETGKLDDTLQKVAEYFEGETRHAVAGLTAALEPVILIILGSMVGLLIISIITPIYKITSSI